MAETSKASAQWLSRPFYVTLGRPSIAEVIDDLYRKLRQPYRWAQMWALLPLFLIRLAAAGAYVLTVMGLLSAGVYTTLDWLVTAGSALCLFILSFTYAGYRTGAIWMAVSLAISILSARLGSVPLLALMSTLSALISNFFEYNAHVHVVSRVSSPLAARWGRLFLWAFGATFIGAFVSMMTLVLSYVFDGMGFLILVVTYLPDLIVDILYLVYLGCTIRLTMQYKE